MKPGMTLWLAIAVAAGLAACSRTETESQASLDNGPLPEGSETGRVAVPANQTNSTATAQPSEPAVSSGMPVPGTNTPEHVVVNEDANRS